jgi:hypothetical protein
MCGRSLQSKEAGRRGDLALIAAIEEQCNVFAVGGMGGGEAQWTGIETGIHGLARGVKENVT